MTAAEMKRRVTRFFREYARRFEGSLQDPPKGDADGVVVAFADYFVGSGPAGVHGGKNGIKFKFVIGRGFAYYRKIGTVAMKIAKLDVTRLDPLHAMASVTWDSRYVRPKDGAKVRIFFTNFYFVRLQRGAPKIFAYVTGDEQALLKKHGLA
ncbi:hypothetical protein M2650_01920 [Luteimonas sp. SX5]|uniref:Nuclear transport factor 2 family protein n=1 Tax=Luteimonas galliterrae TaxID=2940486 RepID=A0ABT0MEW0_9GAMM|nr:hypothetical protein [Luteimonas galliterrae]MCL1633405.1 hypothetical protein [Luteimonas galliterrae]